MNNFFLLLLCLAVGVLTSRYAAQRGRNPRLWFFLGFLFGLLGLLALFLLPSRKARPNNVQLAAPTPLLPPKALIETVDPAHGHKLWYYLDIANQQFGPMSLNALSSAWKEGKVHAKTYVWNDELINWKHFEEVLKPAGSSA